MQPRKHVEGWEYHRILVDSGEQELVGTYFRVTDDRGVWWAAYRPSGKQVSYFEKQKRGKKSVRVEVDGLPSERMCQRLLKLEAFGDRVWRERASASGGR